MGIAEALRRLYLAPERAPAEEERNRAREMFRDELMRLARSTDALRAVTRQEDSP